MWSKRAIGVMTVALATGLTAGCQTKYLKIEPFKSGGEGAPYALRFTQFETKVKWRVMACGRRSARAGENFDDLPNSLFTVRAEVTPEPSFPEDPKNRWLLGLNSLDGWFNTTDLAVTYEGGKFKSFSAAVEDRTVETVTAAAKTAAQIIAIAGVVGSGVKGDACADLVTATDDATKKVEADTAALALAKARLASANAAGVGGKQLRLLQGVFDSATLTLAANTAALEKALKAVTFEQTIRWPTSGSDLPTKTIDIPAEAVAQWSAGRWQDAIDETHLILQLQTYDPNGTLATVTQEDTGAVASKLRFGRLPVRVARPGALVATLTGPAADPDKPQNKEIGRKEASIIQSGDLIYIPVEYRWPRSSTNGFGLDANGNLASISHKQSSAPGETLAKSAQAVSEQVKPLIKSDLEALKDDNAMLEAQKDNAELKKALAPPAEKTAAQQELDAVNSELTLKKAKLELMLVNHWTAVLGGK